MADYMYYGIYLSMEDKAVSIKFAVLYHHIFYSVIYSLVFLRCIELQII